MQAIASSEITFLYLQMLLAF